MTSPRRGDRPRARAEPAVQGRDHRGPAGVGGPDRQLLPPRRVRGPLPRRPSRLDEGARRLQAPQHRRRLLARRRDPPDAPAHLRHRLGHAGGARPAPVARGGGEEAGSPQARPRARPLHLPSRVAGRAVPPSARHGPLAVARGLVAPGPPRGRLQRGAHPEPRPQGAVGDLGPLEQLPGQHVRPGRLRPRLRAEADELPGGDPHLPHAVALVPRAPDALQRLLGPLSARSAPACWPGCSASGS